MSDHRCQIAFSCSWKLAFDFAKESLSRVNASLVHPSTGDVYYFPADGSDRIFFNAEIEYAEGGVQFWIDSSIDIYVSWRRVGDILRFDFDLKGKSLSVQEKIIGALYVSLRTSGMNLVGDGEVLSIVFFDA